MNIFFLKLISLGVFMILPIVINCILFYEKDKKFLIIIVLFIVVINAVPFVFDYFIIKNQLIDYIAFDMLLSFMLSVTFEDMKTKFIDIRVIISYFILFLIYRIVFLDFEIFIEGLLGFVLSLLIMLFGYFVKRNSIGLGDVEMIATCGMIIGFPNIFHFLFKAFLFVFLAGVFLMITKKKKLLSELPLAPFLLLATIL